MSELLQIAVMILPFYAAAMSGRSVERKEYGFATFWALAAIITVLLVI